MTFKSRALPSAVIALGLLVSAGSGVAFAAGDGTTNPIGGTVNPTSPVGANPPPAAPSATTTPSTTHRRAARRVTHPTTPAASTSPNNPSMSTVDGQSGNAKGSVNSGVPAPVPGAPSAGSPNGGGNGGGAK